MWRQNRMDLRVVKLEFLVLVVVRGDRIRLLHLHMLSPRLNLNLIRKDFSKGVRCKLISLPPLRQGSQVSLSLDHLVLKSVPLLQRLGRLCRGEGILFVCLRVLMELEMENTYRTISE